MEEAFTDKTRQLSRQCVQHRMTNHHNTFVSFVLSTRDQNSVLPPLLPERLRMTPHLRLRLRLGLPPPLRLRLRLHRHLRLRLHVRLGMRPC